MLSETYILISLQKQWKLWAIGVLLVAVLLRLWGIGAESAWIDEAFSIVLAQHTFAEILQGTAADQHPPLYYLLLSGWLNLGNSVTFARLLSALIGILGVFLAILFGKQILNPTLGVVGGALVAISPLHVLYSQEIRMYALLALLTLASTQVLWNGLHHPDYKWWLAYGGCMLGGLYTHYVSIFVFLAQGLWIVIWSFRNKTIRQALMWSSTSAIAGLLFLPWIPIAFYQSREHALRWLETPSLTVLRDTFLSAIFGRSIYTLPALGRLIFLGGVIISILAAFQNIRKTKDAENYLFLGWMSLIPFLEIAMVSLFSPIFQFKQLIVLVIPLLLWLAWSAMRLPWWWGGTLLTLIVFFSSASVGYEAVTPTKDNWADATAYIQDNLQANDIVFGNPAAVSLAFSIYNYDPISFTGYPPEYNILYGGWDGETITPEIADGIMQRATAGQHRLWLVEFFPSFWDPNDEIARWLTEHANLQSDVSFGHIRIRLYEIAP